MASVDGLDAAEPAAAAAVGDAHTDTAVVVVAAAEALGTDVSAVVAVDTDSVVAAVVPVAADGGTDEEAVGHDVAAAAAEDEQEWLWCIVAAVVAVAGAGFAAFGKFVLAAGAAEEALDGTAAVGAGVVLVVRNGLAAPVGVAVDPDSQVVDTDGRPFFNALSREKRQVFSQEFWSAE